MSAFVYNGRVQRRQNESSSDVTVVEEFTPVGRYLGGVVGVVDDEEEAGAVVRVPS